MNQSWTDEAETAIDLCATWAKRVKDDVPSQIFLFGSAIYDGGDQFYSDLSDLDIVVLFEEKIGACERIEAVQKLLVHKAELELRMIPALQRTSCDEPGVSIVPITHFELNANVHKSGARRFFTRNHFLNLLTKDHTLGIEGAGTISIDDDHRNALEYVQKIRNEFLSVSANGTGGLKAYSGTDPMPKALLRVAAQQLKDVPAGAWYDTRLGLEDLHRKLGKLRATDSLIDETYKVVSIRRGGRGQRKSLSALHQLALAEILFDEGSSTQTSRIVTWTLRVMGVSFSKSERQRIQSSLMRLAPSAEILDVRAGSIIFEMRSDIRAYETLRRLSDLKVLPNLLEVDACELGESKDLDSPIEIAHDHQDVESKLLAKIAEFQIRESLPEEFVQDEFVAYLNQLRKSGQLPEIDIDEGVYVEGPRPHIVDVEVQWIEDDDTWETLWIEVTSVRSTSQFFSKLDRLLLLNRHIVMVCVTRRELQRRLEQDVRRLNNETRKITVIFVNPIQGDEPIVV
ncbi:hypothetical protein [Paraburkholderia youngii]|uniref:hypothetical protein n=1 Tax=Paraburkholderia youngii TaxID=2782701 RepID=UPI003D217E51